MVATKATRSKLWFARLDGPETFLRQKCEELARALDTVAFLAAFHKGKTGENSHCHFVIELQSEIQKQSYAVRLKKLFEIQTPSQYALDVWDGARGEGAVSYLFHEADERILANKGFTDKDIVDARAANAAIQKVVALNKEKASHKLVERALEEFKDVKDMWCIRTKILKYMVQVCRQGQCYWPGSFMIKKYVEEVELKLMGEDDVDQYVADLEKNLWR